MNGRILATMISPGARIRFVLGVPKVDGRQVRFLRPASARKCVATVLAMDLPTETVRLTEMKPQDLLDQRGRDRWVPLGRLIDAEVIGHAPPAPKPEEVLALIEYLKDGR